ncbi:MAG TPA: IS110 family transposase [Planctomycetaceae bacterium]|nr:IS110 family transposase [Planctomycetaceae bacterium]
MFPRRDRPPSEELRAVHPDAAGIDVHSEFHFVAVPSGRDPQPVRRFSAFTDDLERLADWLTACGVKSVAMESTGVYWIPLFELLERRGFQVILVDPRKLKSVPGRKSDVQDCQWLQQLHVFGLLAAAFRPDEQTCVLRAYLRQRALLVEQAAQHIQHMQKSLTQMNLKLDKVLSDITGVTGLSIIDAILNGERDPRKLALLRDDRCRHDEATIARALVGTWRAEHLFTLKQARELYRILQQLIAECDAQIAAHLETFTDRPIEPPPAGLPPARKKRRYKGGFAFDAQSLLEHKTGVDLTRIDGIDSQTALKVLGEIGLDMSRWPSEKHFASWLALCPDNRESAGRRRSGRTRPSSNRAAAALRMAAQGLHHSKTALGAYLRRMKASLGAPKAITATAHKLALMIYRALKHGLHYVDPGQDWYERQYRERVLKNLTRKAQQLGYQLSPINPSTA